MHSVHQKTKNDRTSTVIHPIKYDNTPVASKQFCVANRSYTSSDLQVYWPRNIQKLHKNSICLYKISEILKNLELNELKSILNINIFCHFLSFLNKFSYFYSRIVQPDRSCHCKTSSFMIIESVAYAVLSVVKSTITYLYESGLWVERQSRHNGRRLSTLCLRLPVIQQINS